MGDKEVVRKAIADGDITGKVATVLECNAAPGVFGLVALNADGSPIGGGGGDWLPLGVTQGGTVGGIPNGTDLGVVDVPIQTTLRQIFYPTLNPTLTAPDNTFVLTQSGTHETGEVIATLNFLATFSRGAITPQYTATSPFRSGLPNTYTYTSPGGTPIPSPIASTALSDAETVIPYTVVAGVQSWTNTVSYDGGVQPKNSAGGDFSTPLAPGTTSAKSVSITGIYPYFYGKVTGGAKPTKDQALINSGTKVIASSTGTITVSFGSGATDWIWFATPATSTTKTVWFINALNNGAIGGGSNLFDSATLVSIDSPTALWMGVSYKIYVSNYQSAVSLPMELRNS